MMFNYKGKYDIDDLLSIVKKLRMPKGCPWDQAQTHKSIRSNLIEEAYEVAEAVDENNAEMLKEELGDLLLQVVFHCQMEDEISTFNFSDVCDGICKKMIYRHPHVFGDVTANNAAEALDTWEAMKKEEKGQKTATDTLNQVTKALPALMYSAKLQKRASKYGFGYKNLEGVMADFESELNELKDAINTDNTQNIHEELGDLIFSAVNLSRYLEVDAEKALYDSTAKFAGRVAYCDMLADKRGVALETVDEETLDDFWTKAKNKTKYGGKL